MSEAGLVILSGAGGFLGRAVSARFTLLGFRVVCFGEPRAGEDHMQDFAAALALSRRYGVVPSAVVALASASPLADRAAQEGVTLGEVMPLIDATDGLCRLVAIGSAAEYGRALSAASLLAEGHLRLPVSPYGRAKAELMDSFAAAHAEGRDTLGLRLFSAAGPGMSRHSLWGSVEAQVKAMKTPVVTRSLGGARDILARNDAAAMIAALALAPRRLPPVINLGSGRATPLRPLLQEVLRCHGAAGLRHIEEADADRREDFAFAADNTLLLREYTGVVARPIGQLAGQIVFDSPQTL